MVQGKLLATNRICFYYQLFRVRKLFYFFSAVHFSSMLVVTVLLLLKDTKQRTSKTR